MVLTEGRSSDSYIRLTEKGIKGKGIIEIIYEKKGYSGKFAVRDYAEGMTEKEIENNFTKYGSATSGILKGHKVRGYFGQGAKDALAGMKNGKICSFKNNQFIECRVFLENGKPMYEIDDPQEASVKIRKMHEIYENGTIAYFEAEKKVPQYDTVHKEIANNYLLRKLLQNENRKIFLLDKNSGKKRRLKVTLPEGKEILSDHFSINYGKYGDFQIDISIYRANVDLIQSGDDRDGGLLLVDDEDAVLGISLFKYENEPLAAKFFGQIRINNFRKLLENEEPVLKEERDGIDIRHDFCQQMVKKIEEFLDLKIKEERLRKQKEDESKIDREEYRRYKKAFSILNEIAEKEAEEIESFGQNVSTKMEDPPNGFMIYPSSAQITVGKKYRFELRINTNIVRVIDSGIKITTSNPKIINITKEIKFNKEDEKGIISKFITIQGIEANISGSVNASIEEHCCESKVFVVPEKELLLEEGLDFYPSNIVLKPHQPRKIDLLVYIKKITGGNIITIKSNNSNINVSVEQITVDEFDAEKHIAKYPIDVWGEGVGQDGEVVAECNESIALLGVKIRDKQERDQTDRKGMFSEPEFDDEPEPNERISYSHETGKVIIYENFPSIRHYLGDKCKYRMTLPCQILLADLLAEKCFLEIARKKVETSGAVLSPDAIPMRIQRDANTLSKKYGKKVHESLVDQKLLKDALSDINKD